MLEVFLNITNLIMFIFNNYTCAEYGVPKLAKLGIFPNPTSCCLVC